MPPDRVNLPKGVFTCEQNSGTTCEQNSGTIKFTFTTGSGSIGYKSRRLYSGTDMKLPPTIVAALALTATVVSANARTSVSVFEEDEPVP